MSYIPNSFTRFTSSADSVTFVGPNHTIQCPQTLTVQRVVPKKGPKGSYSNSRYNVKYVRGIQDSAGNLVGNITLGTTGNSIPVQGVGIGAAVAEGVGIVAAVIGHADFLTALSTNVLPE